MAQSVETDRLEAEARHFKKNTYGRELIKLDIEPAVYRKLVDKDKITVTLQRKDYLDLETSYFESTNNE